MALSGHRFPFTEQNVNNAPTDKGVYALYDENVTIYIGKGRFPWKWFWYDTPETRAIAGDDSCKLSI